jgi:hypothetical protein
MLIADPVSELFIAFRARECGDEQSIETGTIRTKIPARLDRLPWSRFHWIVIVDLGPRGFSTGWTSMSSARYRVASPSRSPSRSARAATAAVAAG